MKLVTTMRECLPCKAVDRYASSNEGDFAYVGLGDEERGRLDFSVSTLSSLVLVAARREK
jgi:hypothetical protein